MELDEEQCASDLDMHWVKAVNECCVVGRLEVLEGCKHNANVYMNSCQAGTKAFMCGIQ